jgi:hypothetical protein
VRLHRPRQVEQFTFAVAEVGLAEGGSCVHRRSVD